MNLIDCINVNLLTPYVDKMVSTFLDQSPQSPAVAHTVGMLIGLYSLCEVICSPFWGAFADKVGRKPALLIGLGGSVIAPIMFGLGKTMPTIFAARALDGFFCGNMGAPRPYMRPFRGCVGHPDLLGRDRGREQRGPSHVQKGLERLRIHAIHAAKGLAPGPRIQFPSALLLRGALRGSDPGWRARVPRGARSPDLRRHDLRGVSLLAAQSDLRISGAEKAI